MVGAVAAWGGYACATASPTPTRAGHPSLSRISSAYRTGTESTTATPISSGAVIPHDWTTYDPQAAKDGPRQNAAPRHIKLPSMRVLADKIVTARDARRAIGATLYHDETLTDRTCR